MPKKDKPVHPAELGRSELRKVKAAINPQNEIENLYAEDWAETSFYKTDLHRALQSRIAAMMPEVLYDMLCRHNIMQDEQDLARLVDRWAKRDPAAKREVETFLEMIGKTEDDVEAEAMLRSLAILHDLDQLQTAASARRDKALAGLVFWRQQIERQKGSDPSSERRACRSADALKQTKDDD